MTLQSAGRRPSAKIGIVLGTLALAWAGTAGISLLPAVAQTTKSSQHNQAAVAPDSLVATLHNDLEEELKGQ
jgi:hypothetical protein